MEQLTKSAFIEKIFDYEHNNDWTFKGSVPVIIDFYADWCGPCKMVAPVLSELSDEYSGKIDVYKINTDEERELAGLFGIRSIPSILFIPLDEKPRMTTGALPKNAIVDLIRDVLKIN